MYAISGEIKNEIPKKADLQPLYNRFREFTLGKNDISPLRIFQQLLRYEHQLNSVDPIKVFFCGETLYLGCNIDLTHQAK